MHTSHKTYPHELGLSCCFRQWRAESHCSLLHGYALAFTFEFAAERLDERGWVVDFGSLKPLRDLLVRGFDHTTCIAEDDPLLPRLRELESVGGCSLRVVPRVGCEAFAEAAWYAAQALVLEQTGGRARCLWAKCDEHGANGATYMFAGDVAGAACSPRGVTWLRGQTWLT